MLVIDVGNSRIKWAKINAGVWTHQGAVDNTQWDFLQKPFAGLAAPARIIVSNVAGSEMAQRVGDLCSRWSAPVHFVVAQAAQCGVTNRYEDLARLGSDRWCALLAAWNNVRHACLVVNCGTATTVDALSDEGIFLGGLILPGMLLMQQSLLHNTAQLNNATGCLQDFPRTTEDAIYSGVIRATLGAIQSQYTRLDSTQTGVCVLSGGAADFIQAQLGLPLKRVDNLVLHGLQIIGDANE